MTEEKKPEPIADDVRPQETPVDPQPAPAPAPSPVVGVGQRQVPEGDVPPGSL